MTISNNYQKSLKEYQTFSWLLKINCFDWYVIETHLGRKILSKIWKKSYSHQILDPNDQFNYNKHLKIYYCINL